MGQAQKPVPIMVVPDKDLDASAVVLRYRASTASAFTDLAMKKGSTGALRGGDPGVGDGRRAGGVFHRGPPGQRLGAGGPRHRGGSDRRRAGPADGAGRGGRRRSSAARPAASDKRLFFSILGGTGFGWASGTGEATLSKVESPGVDWTDMGQIVPEIGYFVTPRFMMGVQGRLQLVRGATPYQVPDPVGNECGDDHICAPYTTAFAGLLKATFFLADPGSAFQPYLSLSAGGGYIRHVSKVDSPKACGPMGGEPCVDTVAGGPVLFGPGVGFRYDVSDGIGIVAQIGGLVGVPNFTANADVNLGLAFRL